MKTSVSTALFVAALMLCVPAVARLYPEGGFSNDFAVYMASPIDPLSYSGLLVIKFWNGRGVTLSNAIPPVFDTSVPLWKPDIAELNILLESRGVLRAMRAFSRPEGDLDAERAEAELAAEEELPDLNAFFFLEQPSYPAAMDMLVPLMSNHVCEIVYLHPNPPELPTPLLVTNQAYLGPAISNGYDVQYAWSRQGGGGTQVKLIDIEYDWYLPHEDLNKTTADLLYGFQTNLFGTSRSHGTAALGVCAAQSNSYGMQGMVFAAESKVASSVNSNGTWLLNDAINVCVTSCAPGDVILLEQQAYANTVYCPVEYWSLFYAAIVNATAMGRIVIEPAGNGHPTTLIGADLDLATWGSMFQRWYRDSLAIMVGAGTAANRSRCQFSDYGSRVDIQGWGDYSVATLGHNADLYGTALSNQYTRSFAGTSSASALSAGAAACVQSYNRARANPSLTPSALRALLVQHGQTQTFGFAGLIGPRPDLRATISSITAVRPWIAITNPAGPVSFVPYVAATVTVAGTNNANVVGSMWWTNWQNGANGIFPVSGFQFQVSNVALNVGGNTIVVSGSNAIGTVAAATTMIMRAVAQPGELRPFVDILTTSSVENVPALLPMLNGTNNEHVMGMMWIYHTGNGEQFPFAATNVWVSPGVTLGLGTNLIEVYGSNLVGQVTNDTLVVIGVPEPGAIEYVVLSIACWLVRRRCWRWCVASASDMECIDYSMRGCGAAEVGGGGTWSKVRRHRMRLLSAWSRTGSGAERGQALNVKEPNGVRL